MKSKIAIGVFAVALAFVVGHGQAEAQVFETVASSTPMYQGGFGTSCFYLRQIHEGEVGYVCDDNAPETAAGRFSMDPIFREATLIDWRARWLNPNR